jgi:hypothetical protein
MELEELNKEVLEIKDKLRNKFKQEGSDVDLSMLKLDVEFVLHALVNKSLDRIENVEDRLRVYTDFLSENV